LLKSGYFEPAPSYGVVSMTKTVMMICVYRANCRKNCSGNPHCLNGLGEKKWMNISVDDYLMSAVSGETLKRDKVWHSVQSWQWSREAIIPTPKILDCWKIVRQSSSCWKIFVQKG